jgi:hypothetical protein
MHARSRLALLALVLAGPGLLGAQTPAQLQPGGRVWLHAHNCYPEKGLWEDRLARALGTGLPYIAIEQDLAWVADPQGHGRSVVSHEPQATGAEPSLQAHFFDRVRPIMERALQEGRRETWPVMVLHLDFKTNEPAHHQFVWDLLGRYEPWLTTAERVSDGRTIMPLHVGPLLVLTEAGAGQAETFHDGVPIGGRLRLFGTVPPRLPTGATAEERAAAAAAAAPEALIPEGASNYRRWTNFPWAVIERGGQRQAGAWTAEDDRRLRDVVNRAHAMGLWVRFYTLNGHAPGTGLGWTESYNFGSVDAVLPRWRAAIAAGVDFVATDQYEEFGRLVSR